MSSLVYSPAIRVHIESDKYGILDISEDLTQWQVNRRVDAVSTFNFTLQNAQRKYDGVFKPGDRITVELKRITWVRVFTGTLNNSAVFSAWPRALPLTASCSLKKLQFWYWDPTTQAGADLVNKYFANNSAQNAAGDGGLSKLATQALIQVSGWPQTKIHFGQVPNQWFKFAQKVESTIDQATSMQAILGSAATIGGTSVSVNGLKLAPDTISTGNSRQALTADQCNNAIIIFATTYQYGIPNPARAATIALMTAMQESSLTNLMTAVDHDSLGLFQQRPSSGWGTPAQVTDPVYATRKFLEHLKGIPGWQTMGLGQAAQAVQISAFPGAYDQWQPMATNIVSKLSAQLTVGSKVSVGSAAASTTVGNPGVGSATPGIATGAAVAKVASDLITSRPAGSIIYHNDSSTDIDTTPNPTKLDCSALVNWVYYHATGQHLQPSGQHYSGDQWSKCVAHISVDLAANVMGAALFIGPGGNEHVGISLGNGEHVAAHMQYSDPTKDVNISPISQGGGFTSAGLLPGIDYTAAATTASAAAQLAAVIKHATTVGQAGFSSTSDPSVGASTANSTFQQLVSVLTSPPVTSGNIFGGARALMNNQPFLPWVKNVVNSSMRSFCSAPNGDFMAWFPDYFGYWGTAASMNIEPIELQDFTVDWSDQQIVTHEYVLGSQLGLFDSTSGGVVDGSDPSYAGINQMLATKGVVTMDFPQIFQAIYGKAASAKFVKEYQDRFGARPNVDQMANIKTGPQEFFMALWNFILYWSNQFTASVPMTFMPELWPGMLLKIPQYDFQCYVNEVTHQGSYGPNGGFYTTASICAPARTSNRTDLFGMLPLAG